VKKQIVITLTETDGGYTGYIQGIVGNKRTDKIYSNSIPQHAHYVIDQMSVQSVTIQQWMEQINNGK
jgi:hypothetical protein